MPILLVAIVVFIKLRILSILIRVRVRTQIWVLVRILVLVLVLILVLVLRSLLTLTLPLIGLRILLGFTLSLLYRSKRIFSYRLISIFNIQIKLRLLIILGLRSIFSLLGGGFFGSASPSFLFRGLFVFLLYGTLISNIF